MPGKQRIRITGGSARGFPLPSPKGTWTRPTPSVVREAIFNILHEDVEGAAVLELFAGVGTLGFEALSRGAAAATFVEKRRAVGELILQTARRLGWEDRTDVLRVDAFRAPGVLEERERVYSLVFLDPPYAYTREIVPGARIHKLFEALATSETVGPGASLVLQHPCNAKLRLDVPEIVLEETRPYGSTAITILTKQNRC